MFSIIEYLFDYRRNVRITILVFFSAFVLISYTSNIVYGAGVSEGCGVFDIKPGCDLSGWLHLVIDSSQAGALALFLHFLATKQTAKLEHIITNQENKRLLKEKFSAESLKNDFTSILFSISLINQLINKLDIKSEEYDNTNAKIKDELVRLQNISLTLQYTSLTSSDVLKPEVLTEIEQIRRLVRNPIKTDDKVYSFPKYHEIKDKITRISNLLNSSN